jgi:DNA-directed RNA polymerase specialized sigma24 family protein
MISPETIHLLKSSYSLELRQKAYQLTGSISVAEDITMFAFAKLLQNSFWIWNEKRAKKYLNRIVTRQCKKYQRLNDNKPKPL